MKKYLFRVLILLVILWAIGGVLFLPETQQSLKSAAADKLDERANRSLFKQIKVDFAGQEATLTGIVALEEEKLKAAQIIGNDLRLPRQRGGDRNPVTAVHNQIVVSPEATDRKSHWLIASLQPGSYRLDGQVRSSTQITRLIEQFTPRVPGLSPVAVVQSNDSALPAVDWDGTLAKVPDFKPLLEGKQDKERGLIAVTNCDGNWTVLPPSATSEEVSAALKNPKVTPTDINRSLTSLRAWFNGPSQAELDRLAADEKARQEAKAKAEAEAKEKMEAQREAARLAAAGPPRPAFLGVAAAGKKLHLFGAMPTDAEKSLAISTALKTYPESESDNAQLKLEANRTLPSPLSLQLPAAPQGKANFITVATFDGTNKVYDADAFDSEIARDFPSLNFKEGELATALLGYRTDLSSAGAITKDDPYLALTTDGKSLILAGEVADAETKSKLLAKLSSANPTLPVVDKLQVSALVNASPDLAPTLDTIPAFTAGTAGVAVARPGLKWRTSVVHSIYFKTGSNRSKDQERAISQMQRIRELLPAASFEIVGHSDNVGKPDANKKLSLERAKSFLDVATAAGFDPATLTPRGAGPDEPIAPNDTPENKALNRRVDVMLK